MLSASLVSVYFTASTLFVSCILESDGWMMGPIVNGFALMTGQSIDSIAGVPEEFRHVVWTYGMRRLAVLVGRALRFGESVLLVGDTG